jgi:hypothetical protein
MEKKRVSSAASGKLPKSSGRRGTADVDALVGRDGVGKARQTRGCHQPVLKTSALTNKSARLGEPYSDASDSESCGRDRTDIASVRGKRPASVGVNALSDSAPPKHKRAKQMVAGVGATLGESALLGNRRSESVASGKEFSGVNAPGTVQKTQNRRDREEFYKLKYLADVPTTDWRQWTDDFKARMLEILVNDIFPYVKFVVSPEDIGKHGYMGLVFRKLGYGEENNVKHEVFRLRNWFSIAAYTKKKIGMLRNNVIADCKKMLAGTVESCCVLDCGLRV